MLNSNTVSLVVYRCIRSHDSPANKKDVFPGSKVLKMFKHGGREQQLPLGVTATFIKKVEMTAVRTENDRRPTCVTESLEALEVVILTGRLVLVVTVTVVVTVARAFAGVIAAGSRALPGEL